jgi:hypothetical protein
MMQSANRVRVECNTSDENAPNKDRTTSQRLHPLQKITANFYTVGKTWIGFTPRITVKQRN